MRLPVLMYHDITQDGEPNFLTIRSAELDRQLKYIRQKGYQSVSLQQLHDYLTKGKTLPAKPVLITFDDGYKSNFRYLYPLLQQYGLKASIFLVADFVETKINTPRDKYLHLEELQQMSIDLVDYGYHSFDHKNYNELSIAAIEEDLQKMQYAFRQMPLEIVPLFAYTYGAFPKKDAKKRNQLEQLFQRYGIPAAFRIGNRINSTLAGAPFQIQRIDIRGNDSFGKFKMMLRFGRKWLF